MLRITTLWSHGSSRTALLRVSLRVARPALLSYYGGYSTCSVVWTLDTFENNFGIDPKFTEYLKESFGLDFHKHFSFKYYLKIPFIREISPKHSTSGNTLFDYCRLHLGYASSVSFGHPEHCFLTVWTPKSLLIMTILEDSA